MWTSHEKPNYTPTPEPGPAPAYDTLLTVGMLMRALDNAEAAVMHGDLHQGGFVSRHKLLAALAAMIAPKT